MGMIALLIACAAFIVSLYCLCRVLKLEARAEARNDRIPSGSQYAGGGSETALQSQELQDVAEEKYRPYESNDEMFIARLEELVDANLGNHDLNVDFLAAGMMVSRSLLFNRVRRATGKGIVEFVNDIRIERSIAMFSDHDKSLTEIAELSGFSTLRYYSRVFKSVKGEIPSVYRDRILARTDSKPE